MGKIYYTPRSKTMSFGVEFMVMHILSILVVGYKPRPKNYNIHTKKMSTLYFIH